MGNNAEEIIVVQTEVGNLARQNCRSTHPKIKPVYDFLQQAMLERGWVDSESVVVVDDLTVGTLYYTRSQKTYFALRAYRGNPPETRNGSRNIENRVEV